MSASDIAEALKAGGVQSEAANFANNVFAFMTTTMKSKQEVVSLPDGKWKLSPNGESAITHIQATDKFWSFLRTIVVWIIRNSFLEELRYENTHLAPR